MDASGVLAEAALQFDMNSGSPCDHGNDEAESYVKSHGITSSDDKRLCNAVSTWFGPKGTRLPGLL